MYYPEYFWKSVSCLFVLVLIRELFFTLIVWQAIISIQGKATADASTNVGEFINYFMCVVASGEVGDTADVLIHDNDFKNRKEMMRFFTENRILTFLYGKQEIVTMFSVSNNILSWIELLVILCLLLCLFVIICYDVVSRFWGWDLGGS